MTKRINPTKKSNKRSIFQAPGGFTVMDCLPAIPYVPPKQPQMIRSRRIHSSPSHFGDWFKRIEELGERYIWEQVETKV
ncbi:putative orfan [Tupanvirus soda lake]|uniref:Orfan n=2 Tax=Tupanvirus TaxID=2094720 RepID=A0AC62ADG1_9VIRU|nr:putative orfan [Tupanvirus soda lake]QKU35711.1 putative orfan [Tupanvirus soda lake]